MSELKHTPGPWALVRDTRPHMEWNITIVRQDNPNFAVCFMTSDGPNEANAHLIKSAPDLLDMLQCLTGPADDPVIGWRGSQPSRPDHFACEFCGAEHLDCTQIAHAEDCFITRARLVIAKATGEEPQS